MKFSLIDLQVINQALKNVAEETGIVLQFSAFSPNIRERLDFSSAVLDENGRLIAQAEHIPVHLGAMQESVKALINVIGKDSLKEGDIYIMNNPYCGGTHLPDITICKPIFYENKLVGFVANRAHHADVGGKVPGSMPGGEYSLEEEGFVIEPTLLERHGKLNTEWLNEFLKNVRIPKERKGDLNAQLAATKIGEKKLLKILDKYSLSKVKGIIEFLNERSRQATIKLIKQIPEKISFEFTDYMDNDGVIEESVPITARICRKGNVLTVDYRDSAPQTKGNINAPKAVTISATYYVIRCLISKDYATNYGLYEPIRVITKSGTVVDPLPPAGVAAGNVETSQRIVDVLLGVFSQIFPKKIPAASSGTMNNIIIGGLKENGEEFTYYETIAGGIGAGYEYSPPNARHSHMTNTRNTSIEVLESYYPLRVLEYSIIPNTGGQGKWCGSNGVRRAIQLLSKEGILSIQSERRNHSPFGLFGGEGGKCGRNILISDNKEYVLPSKITKKMKQNDIIIIETPGGGGYGSYNVIKNG
ncbi:MAG: hydantoinase B/oxoprolinase family protein [Candidatus Heimdallarchaeaceae archaeon]